MNEQKLPCPLIDDPNWIYIPAASTDVAKTWAKFGWTPPSHADNVGLLSKVYGDK